MAKVDLHSSHLAIWYELCNTTNTYRYKCNNTNIYTTTSILKINISQHAIREGRNIRLSLKNSTTGRNEAKNEAKQGYKCVSWTCQLLFIIVLAFLVLDVLVSSTHYSVVMGPCRDWERDCKNFVETGDISPESSSGTSVHLSNPSD